MRSMLALILLVSGVLSFAEESSVPLGTMKTFSLSVPKNAKILAIDAYFKAEKPTFAKRICVITFNNHVLTSQQLLRDKKVFPLRLPGHLSGDRVHEETNFISFPYTEKPYDMKNYDFNSRNEYDKWVPVYRSFTQTLYFNVDGLLKAGETTAEVKIFNNVNRPDKGYKMPLQILNLAMIKTLPAPREDQRYFAPIWYVLDQDPRAFKDAVAKLADQQTDKQTKAQLCWSFGLLNQVKGNPKKAADFYKKALSFSDSFPERNEVIYRLEDLGFPQPDAKLDTRNPNGQKWAELVTRMRNAKQGKDDPYVLDIPFYDGPFKSDGKADEPIWSDKSLKWHDIDYVVNGEIPDPKANKFALFYNGEALMLIYKGPGSEGLMFRNFPGEDRPVWEFNCVELFVVPSAAFTYMYELNVSSTNGRFDNRMRWNGVQDLENFRASWETGASISPKQMIVEYRVPWSDFNRAAPPEPDDLWAANVIKVQHLIDKEGKDTYGEASVGKLLWRNFHRVQDGFIMRFKPPAERK